MRPFSRRRPFHAPSHIQQSDKVGLGARLMAEMSLRVFDRRIWRDAWDQHAYCLDAPDTLLCGSVAYDEFGPEPDDWLAMPTTVQRDDIPW